MFFAFYLAIAIRAKREALRARRCDAGVRRAATLALQAAPVRGTRPPSWPGGAFAAAAVALALYRGRGFALLARAFFVIAILCVTVAIPFAADPQWTLGWWGRQAIGVYGIGRQQEQALPRAFAGSLYLLFGIHSPAVIFLNATFLGSIFIAVRPRIATRATSADCHPRSSAATRSR